LWREKQAGKTKRRYEPNQQTPYQRLGDCPDMPEATKVKLRAKHATLDPYELKKSIELKLRKFFTALGNLNREAMKLQRGLPSATFCRESTRRVHRWTRRLNQ